MSDVLTKNLRLAELQWQAEQPLETLALEQIRHELADYAGKILGVFCELNGYHLTYHEPGSDEHTEQRDIPRLEAYHEMCSAMMQLQNEHETILCGDSNARWLIEEYGWQRQLKIAEEIDVLRMQLQAPQVGSSLHD